jgi:hypothetical protein
MLIIENRVYARYSSDPVNSTIVAAKIVDIKITWTSIRKSKIYLIFISNSGTPVCPALVFQHIISQLPGLLDFSLE